MAVAERAGLLSEEPRIDACRTDQGNDVSIAQLGSQQRIDRDRARSQLQRRIRDSGIEQRSGTADAIAC